MPSESPPGRTIVYNNCALVSPRIKPTVPWFVDDIEHSPHSEDPRPHEVDQASVHHTGASQARVSTPPSTSREVQLPALLISPILNPLNNTARKTPGPAGEGHGTYLSLTPDPARVGPTYSEFDDIHTPPESDEDELATSSFVQSLLIPQPSPPLASPMPAPTIGGAVAERTMDIHPSLRSPAAPSPSRRKPGPAGEANAPLTEENPRPTPSRNQGIISPTNKGKTPRSGGVSFHFGADDPSTVPADPNARGQSDHWEQDDSDTHESSYLRTKVMQVTAASGSRTKDKASSPNVRLGGETTFTTNSDPQPSTRSATSRRLLFRSTGSEVPQRIDDSSPRSKKARLEPGDSAGSTGNPGKAPTARAAGGPRRPGAQYRLPTRLLRF